MAKKKEPINLMPARTKTNPYKKQNIYHLLFTNFLQVRKSYFKNLEKKWLEVIQKVCLQETSIFWPSSPLFIPVPFTYTPINVISLYWATTTLKKSSAIFTNFQMKNWWVKTEKDFFVDSKDETLIFFTQLYMQWQ